ncbi:hypothetical protein LEP1GSC079_3001 [Leptospira interrogans str. FPW1039]|uniref:Uncharacterized protein n=1 Tax=Leptospira interrogans str. FPW1039 TaxID=1193040 RepID=A0A0F6IAU7_LEPIR|nr:hypothetical protein LEP1GSC099_3524 [Leptospira interrogans str. UI 08452]EMJ35172.1 hypothetical protein LEP1GSC079_3001 [Leptospira interrogans str. FPW1039]EMJ55294.1 hypothetical protein LEP1GSC111_0927 [Leptospira interrogans str. UT126]EMN36166.1 hypothetical protein LEP1GSC084_4552 [Leptospira interrogans serovar Medanensis str. L0448]EMN96513.1 hypothetical protein LEP1GSC110_0621 [Leptospira interrogans serovar Medanensis str. UT053]
MEKRNVDSFDLLEEYIAQRLQSIWLKVKTFNMNLSGKNERKFIK